MKKDLLGELEKISKVVNSFNSETVQLRVLDVLLKESLSDDEEPTEKVSKRGRKKIEKTVEPKIETKVDNTVVKVDQPVKVKRGRKPKIKTESKIEVAKPKKEKKDVKKSPSKKAKVNKNEVKKEVGASKTIQALISEGYFKEKKSINDLIQYCSEKLNSSLKMTDVSGILGRMVKNGTLKREKNIATSKFEYINA